LNQKKDFTNLDGTMDDIPEQNNIVLEVRNLERRYGDLLAVDNLSLKVKHGEILGILGPNGAGKTTSIRMMCGLLRPTSGEILIDGRKVDAAGSAEVRSKVGICPQENILWNKLTCFEQLVFSAKMYNVPSKTARERADQLLAKMGLESKRNKLAGTLSGGMKRRMNVILTIMHDPEIMVFDEPEAGLDPQSRIVLREFIRETSREKTVIVTTHNMDEAERIADRVAIIDSGRLLQLDTPHNLKKSIGKGDILELRLMARKPANLEKALTKLKEKGYSVIRDDDDCVIRAMDLVPKIHEIYKVLEEEKVSVSEMKVRENTLEDVFIHLTGKSLRI
jgi:ABC-2 type transport system ATP-binding protein